MNNEQNNYVYINSNEVEFLEAYKTFIRGIYKLGDVNVKDGYYIFHKVDDDTMTCEYIYYVKDIARVFNPNFTIRNRYFNRDKFKEGVKYDYVYELAATVPEGSACFMDRPVLREVCSEKVFYLKEKYKYSISQESFVK